jgi:hypothetical protein
MQNVLDTGKQMGHIVSMPRCARLDAPGVLHHVIGRGIEKGKIFLTQHDRNDFLSRLATLAQEGSLSIYAWREKGYIFTGCRRTMCPHRSSVMRIGIAFLEYTTIMSYTLSAFFSRASINLITASHTT